MNGIPKDFPKDLREMDEGQFKRMFEFVRRETKDWTEIKLDLLNENPQLLIIIRCALGISQRKLSKILDLHFDTIMKVESKIIRFKQIKRSNRNWVNKLNHLLNNSKISFEDSIRKWNEFKKARFNKFPEFPVRMKPISKVTKKELRERFENLRFQTNNFSFISPDKLFSNPQNILILRLLFGFSQREFSRFLDVDNSCLNGWEHLDNRMKIQTAENISEKISDLMSKTGSFTFKELIHNFIIVRKRRGSLDWRIENGLTSAKNSELRTSEKVVLENLGKINFDLHSIVEGLKRRMNVDFAIPNGDSPKVIIEAFTFSLRRRNASDLRRKICEIDHRFQMLKLKHFQLKTIIFLRATWMKDLDISQLKTFLGTELLNTDILLINEEVKGISQIIQGLMDRANAISIGA